MGVSKLPTLTLALFLGLKLKLFLGLQHNLHLVISSLSLLVDSAALNQQVEALKGQLQHLEATFSRYKRGEFLRPSKTWS